MSYDCPISKLIDAFNSSQNYLSNDVLRYKFCHCPAMLTLCLCPLGCVRVGRGELVTYTPHGDGVWASCNNYQLTRIRSWKVGRDFSVSYIYNYIII